MACNCNKNKAQVSYVYTHPVTRKKSTYKTQIEAEAAKIRNKGGSISTVTR